MTKNYYEKLNEINLGFFESSRRTIIDPMGLEIANDVKWIKLSKQWNSSKFPVVMGGIGQPLILLHGFDSSFLELRRIYPSLKKKWQLFPTY